VKIKIILLIITTLLSALAKAETAYRVPESISATDTGEYLPKAHYKILGFSIEKLSLNDNI